MPEERKLSVFERYLTLWVFLCMIVGSLLGRWLPSIPVALDKKPAYCCMSLFYDLSHYGEDRFCKCD